MANIFNKRNPSFMKPVWSFEISVGNTVFVQLDIALVVTV